MQCCQDSDIVFLAYPVNSEGNEFVYGFIQPAATKDRVCKGSTNVATSRPDRLAQWIARQTSNLKVAGSSPALVKPCFLLSTIVPVYIVCCAVDDGMLSLAAPGLYLRLEHSVVQTLVC